MARASLAALTTAAVPSHTQTIQNVITDTCENKETLACFIAGSTHLLQDSHTIICYIGPPWSIKCAAFSERGRKFFGFLGQFGLATAKLLISSYNISTFSKCLHTGAGLRAQALR